MLYISEVDFAFNALSNETNTKKRDKLERICLAILKTTLCQKNLQKDGLGASRGMAACRNWPELFVPSIIAFRDSDPGVVITHTGLMADNFCLRLSALAM